MEKFYWYWLSNVPGIGPVKIRKLLEVFDTPEQIYKASEQNLKNAGLNQKDYRNIFEAAENPQIYKNYLKLKASEIKISVPSDADYPEKLRTLYDAPPCIYYKGRLPGGRPAVALVGSRSCTQYGRSVAFELGRKLAAAGVDVISGLAAGIDTCGHSGAIEEVSARCGAGRPCASTYAVLGCGPDICYPAMNRRLYQQITESGGVLSEYPPGTQPSPGQFPMRNRIISGLSDIVVVVEARKKSGSLITVDQALEQNREVMAVPGRLGDKASEGCNNLIRMGAGMVTCVEDILENLKNFVPEKQLKNEKKKFCLASEEEMVYSGLDFSPKSLEEIVEATGYNLSDLMHILMRLEAKGAVKETARNFYTRL